VDTSTTVGTKAWYWSTVPDFRLHIKPINRIRLPTFAEITRAAPSTVCFPVFPKAFQPRARYAGLIQNLLYLHRDRVKPSSLRLAICCCRIGEGLGRPPPILTHYNHSTNRTTASSGRPIDKNSHPALNMADSKFPPIPPPLPGSKTYAFKHVNNIAIEVDVYLPSIEAHDSNQQSSHPVLLFIHGGGWIGGHRKEYCRPLFEDFLQRRFIVVSTDYRLLPESEFVQGQLEDIRDLGNWVRNDLSVRLEQEEDVRVEIGKVVVAGASAGALLALLTVSQRYLHPSSSQLACRS
jgi:hypothetical protein